MYKPFKTGTSKPAETPAKTRPAMDAQEGADCEDFLSPSEEAPPYPATKPLETPGHKPFKLKG